MPTLTFIHKDGTIQTIDAPLGHSVMEIAVKNNIDPIEGACGGGLACATCHVYVHPDWWERALPKNGAVSEEERDMLELAFYPAPRSRLSCQILMTPDLDGLIVALPGSKTDGW